MLVLLPALAMNSHLRITGELEVKVYFVKEH